MIDQKYYVTKEVAKLLLEKGFKHKCDFCYDYSGKDILLPTEFLEHKQHIPAPLICEVLDWLDYKKINVSIQMLFTRPVLYYGEAMTYDRRYFTSKKYTSREEALNKVILKVLKNKLIN
jgi:hypothetical protein